MWGTQKLANDAWHIHLKLISLTLEVQQKFSIYEFIDQIVTMYQWLRDFGVQWIIRRRDITKPALFDLINPIQLIVWVVQVDDYEVIFVVH